jgi:transcription termination factor NusB
LAFSVCDEPKANNLSENQERIYEKINKLNDILNQLFQQWAKNLSQLREIAVAIIQFGMYKIFLLNFSTD